MIRQRPRPSSNASSSNDNDNGSNNNDTNNFIKDGGGGGRKVDREHGKHRLSTDDGHDANNGFFSLLPPTTTTTTTTYDPPTIQRRQCRIIFRLIVVSVCFVVAITNLDRWWDLEDQKHNSKRTLLFLKSNMQDHQHHNIMAPPESILPPNHRPRRRHRRQQHRLYHCGWETFSHLDRVFPDYRVMDEPWNAQKANVVGWNDTTTTVVRDDILIVLMYSRKCPRPVDVRYEFRGKVLWVRAEPKYWTLETYHRSLGGGNNRKNPKRIQQQYQMGAFATDRHTPEDVATALKNLSTTPDRYWKSRTLQVHFLAFVVMEHVYDAPQRWAWLTDPTQRRVNTGRHYAVAYFARNCVDFRQETATNLSTFLQLPIHYAHGGCSVDGKRNVAVRGKPRTNYTQNYELFHDYRYCLVMENTVMDGYITEKILNAFLGGCIPIYYGTTQIFDVFNRDAFVFYDIHRPDQALEHLERLESDVGAYRRMLHAPILRDGSNTIDQYFSLYPNIEQGSLNRRIRDLLHLPPLYMSSSSSSSTLSSSNRDDQIIVNKV